MTTMAKFMCSTKEGHPERAVEASGPEQAALAYKSMVGLDGIGMPIDIKEVTDSNPKHPEKSRRTVKDEDTVTPEQTEGLQRDERGLQALMEGPTDKPTERANVTGSKALTTRERAEQAKVEKHDAAKADAGKAKKAGVAKKGKGKK